MGKSISKKIIPVCHLEDIPVLGGIECIVGGERIALFRLGSGAVRATVATCPHKGGPLCFGLVAGEVVYCPLHEWKISLADGLVEDGEQGAVPVYPVEVVDNEVYIVLSESSPHKVCGEEEGVPVK
ncbi:Rieske 2Fe-2S domain-containing protein [Alicyclobacillus mali (ex Roth et al. 2021)]|uniref:Rieske 2Fe-2S domain-containing protein n=1 Tax=Alicyclobacillus mali (ex Roth et al. 2021) TaxID=1123961 RepID=UPI0023F35612|nr:Rieske 2Fe-2S domain-containing protein [Alicyclobacillus mali (ex Roth et al. 2021)]